MSLCPEIKPPSLCSDLGAHIDGYIAVQATTVVVQEAVAPITGRVADAIACAHTCFEAALRLIRPGKRISDVAGPLNAIAEAYGCTMVEGVMTHNMKQFVIDGNKCVLNKPTADQKVENGDFEENEVFAIDIVVSTGTRCLPSFVDARLTHCMGIDTSSL
jgi:methionine aminopeptidase